MFHTWISTDTPEHDQCLTCGGMWINTEPEEFVIGLRTMQAMNGDYPTPCPGIDRDPEHECNCLQCDTAGENTHE